MIEQKKRSSISKDLIYNFASSGVATGVLQLIVYPVIAKIIGATQYGIMLTIFGIINTIATSILGALNNTHLIKEQTYQAKKIKGDFNILFVFSSAVSILVLSIIFLLYIKINFLLTSFLVVLVLLQNFKNYYSVSFRIKLDFKSNFIHKIIISVGYLTGLIFVVFSKYWVISFLIGELAGLIFLLKKTSLYRDGYNKTENIESTVRTFLILVLTSILGSAFIYFDRLFIYPVLGPDAVSTYSVASYVGKSLAIFMTPIASVLLSYYSKSDFMMTHKKFWNVNILGAIGSGAFVFASYFLSPLITRILYPDIYEQAKDLIFLANSAAAIGIYANLIQPAVLKFAPTIWQVIVTALYGVAYLILGFLLTIKFNLVGFSFSVMVSNILRLGLLAVIGAIYVKKHEKKENLLENEL